MKTKNIHKTNNTKKTQNRKKTRVVTQNSDNNPKTKKMLKVYIKGTREKLLNIFAVAAGSIENII